MTRFLATALVLVLVVGSAIAAEPLHVELRERKLEPGVREVVLTLYAAEDGGAPLATEKRSVLVDANGSFSTPVAWLTGPRQMWLSVRVPPGPESRRVAVAAHTSGDVKIQVVTNAVISGNGIVESIAQGFRFPDASLQAAAANPSGATPSTVSGSTGGAGASADFSRADHIHPHGNLAGGSLHAEATTSTAGFMSSTDKTKLNAVGTYARTIYVSGGGTDAANGTALTTALANISGNSATSPYLVKIEPGVYDIGVSTLTMKTYVDIEGSGQNATFIKSQRSQSSAAANAAAVAGAVNAEIRELTITNSGAGGAIGIGFFATGTGAYSVRNVTINSTSGTGTSYGIYMSSSAQVFVRHATVNATAISNGHATALFATTSATPVIHDSTLKGTSPGGTGTAIGIHTSSSTVVATVDSSTIVGTGSNSLSRGIYVALGDVTVTNSTVRAETAGSRVVLETTSNASSKLKVSHSLLFAFSTSLNSSHVNAIAGTNSILYIATSMLDSATSGSPAKCVHIYDDTYSSLANTCPTPPL